MDLELLASLVVLALVDSTSFGTLVIPLWLMLAPGRLRPDRVLLFLITIAGFYLALGIALVAGASTLLDQFGDAMDSMAARIIQYGVGFALIVTGITMEPWTKAGKAKRAERRAEREARRGPGRLTRWRARATDGSAPATAVVTLASAAAAVEAASMVPYLAAIGLITAADLSVATTGGVLIGYCLVMIVPGLILLAARMLLHDRIAPSLTRIENWMTRSAREATAWVVFLLGLYLVSSVESGLLG